MCISTSQYKLVPQLRIKMKLALHTVICCCVFTAVLPLVKGTTEELNNSLKKSRFRVWLQSRNRDLHDSSESVHELCLEIQDDLEQDGAANTVSPPPSSGQDNRPRRSPSSQSVGCIFITCSYNDLIHRLHQMSNKQKDTTAPEKHFGAKGYGRRRRSLLDFATLARKQRRSRDTAQRVHQFRSTNTMA